MKATICKQFDFDAAHWLPKVAQDHKCHRMHGHTYRCDVICAGGVDGRGMVLDYAEISDAWKPLNDLLDHRVLNEIEGLGNPTTEVLAPFIFNILERVLVSLVAIRVYESSTTWCEVRKP